MSSRRHFLTLAAALATTPAWAASPAADPAGFAPPGADSVQLLAKLSGSMRGFRMGPELPGAREVFIAFDMQCTDSHKLWFAALPLSATFNFTWIPVAVMDRRSESQAALMLDARDPAALMDRHLEQFASMQRGLATDSIAVSDDLRDAVWLNTRLLRATGARSVPTGAFRRGSGEVIAFDDRIKPADLRHLLQAS